MKDFENLSLSLIYMCARERRWEPEMSGQGRLILYDTGNFRDYPVGGQVTSIKNFLRFLRETMPEHCKDVLLVGVSRRQEDIGRMERIRTEGGEYAFLAVAQAATDLSHVKKSLRLEYVKGLIRYRKLIRIRKEDCCYIHTPEAFGPVRLLCPRVPCYLFSHGTYMDMWKRVRFFKKAPWIRRMFHSYLMHALRKSTAVFVLDQETRRSYSAYNSNVIRVDNSIVCMPREERALSGDCIRFLYAGRLNVGKGIGTMIEAVKDYHRNCRFIILGDGEERENLEKIAAGSDRIQFVGAVSPAEVLEVEKKADIFMINSVSEGIPMAILEAISAGLPVITTDVGGIGEVLTFGQDSEKTDGSAGQIQEAMDKIISDYGRYSENAYEKSLRFDYRKVNQKIFDILNKNLGW